MLEDKPVFNLTAHKALWEWRAEHINSYMADWPGWDINGGSYDAAARCFACQYTKEIRAQGCKECPLIWPGKGHATCMMANNAWDGILEHFNIAVKMGHKRKAVRYAHVIANLPVKEGVETC